MGLNELIGWPGAMTHRQFMAWCYWLAIKSAESARESGLDSVPASAPTTHRTPMIGRRTPVIDTPRSEEEIKKATAIKKAWVLGGLGMRIPKDYTGDGPIRLERIPDIERKK